MRLVCFRSTQSSASRERALGKRGGIAGDPRHGGSSQRVDPRCERAQQRLHAAMVVTRPRVGRDAAAPAPLRGRGRRVRHRDAHHAAGAGQEASPDRWRRRRTRRRTTTSRDHRARTRRASARASPDRVRAGDPHPPRAPHSAAARLTAAVSAAALQGWQAPTSPSHGKSAVDRVDVVRRPTSGRRHRRSLRCARPSRPLGIANAIGSRVRNARITWWRVASCLRAISSSVRALIRQTSRAAEGPCRRRPRFDARGRTAARAARRCVPQIVEHLIARDRLALEGLPAPPRGRRRRSCSRRSARILPSATSFSSARIVSPSGTLPRQ